MCHSLTKKCISRFMNNFILKIAYTSFLIFFCILLHHFENTRYTPYLSL